MNYKKLQEFVEAVNTYYAFLVLLYAVVLFMASHSYLFYWVFVLATPLVAGWTGYLLHSYLQQRNQRHGFALLSHVMRYEIGSKKYTLHLGYKLKACKDHLSIYSVGYQWSGKGTAELPKLKNPGQQLLSVVNQDDKTEGAQTSINPYRLSSTDGSWDYWFIAFNPPVHKGGIVDLDYSQVFHDEQGMAKPYVFYTVRTPMKQLELSVKFPKNSLPKKVIGSYTKPDDPRRPIVCDSLQYDPEKQWATWIIEKPKRNHCYRIDWE